MMQKRQTAYRVWVKHLLQGPYVRNEEDWAPNYVDLGDKKVSRVNLLGAIVAKQDGDARSFVLDDGSARVIVRSFDGLKAIESLAVGTVVVVIGRPREYGDERYVVPEIVKPVADSAWVRARALELGDKDRDIAAPPLPQLAGQTMKEEVIGSASEEVVFGAAAFAKGVPAGSSVSPSEAVYSLIKSLDSGDGANTDEVASRSGVADAESIITQLLSEGEVYEIRPGKLKVLE
ncbi:TPA: hypothetical protein HA270_05445 [Candidatus Woesearchaeota archaeon]|nr:hypothetical protein [Candidatus Woesearchaeota archaeon]